MELSRNFGLTSSSKDKDGEEISASTHSIRADYIANVGPGEFYLGESRAFFAAAPFIRGYCRGYYIWKWFDIAKDDMPKIASVDIEIEQ